jgi:transposase
MLADNQIDKPIHTNFMIDFGLSQTALFIAREIGLLKLLENIFPDNYKEIIKIAIYFLANNNTVDNIRFWEGNARYSYGKVLDGSLCSNIFKNITFDDQINFFTEWVKLHRSIEYICYDVTAIRNYSKKISLADYGHDYRKTGLPQINYGLYFAQDSRLPIYYHMYQGSINDVSDFENAVEFILALGLKDILFVIDRGFCSYKNINCMFKNNYKFIIPLPSNRKDFKELIDKYKGIVVDSANLIHEHKIFGIPVEYSFCDVPVYAYIFFDHKRAVIDLHDLSNKLSSYDDELANINTKTVNLTKYNNYYNIEKNLETQDKQSIIFSRDREKINKEMSYHGYFIFISSKKDISPDILINIYKERDIIEKAFHNIKSGLDFDTMKTHSDETTYGKMFVCFLSLILRSYLFNKIKGNSKTKQLTIEQTITLLSLYKEIHINGNVNYLTLCKKTKDIFSVIGIDPSKFVKIT